MMVRGLVIFLFLVLQFSCLVSGQRLVVDHDNNDDDDVKLATEDRQLIGHGSNVDGKNDYRFMVSLQFTKRSSYRHWCGGSLIHPRWVLTAAHCIKYDSYVSFYGMAVQAGTYNIGNPKAGTLRKVKKVVRHPDYYKDHDVGLVMLESPINDLPLVQLNDGEDNSATAALNKVGQTHRVVGWGYDENGVFPDHLQTTQITVLDHKVCEPIFDWGITDKILCAGATGNGKQNICPADSGSPLFHWNGNNAIQVGIAARGKGCGDGSPNVYTKVSSFVSNFIKHTLEEHGDSLPNAGTTPGDTNGGGEDNTIVEPSGPPTPSPTPTLEEYLKSERLCTARKKAGKCVKLSYCSWNSDANECITSLKSPPTRSPTPSPTVTLGEWEEAQSTCLRITKRGGCKKSCEWIGTKKVGQCVTKLVGPSNGNDDTNPSPIEEECAKITSKRQCRKSGMCKYTKKTCVPK